MSPHPPADAIEDCNLSPPPIRTCNIFGFEVHQYSFGFGIRGSIRRMAGTKDILAAFLLIGVAHAFQGWYAPHASIVTPKSMPIPFVDGHALPAVKLF
jgi:hypothetical protein